MSNSKSPINNPEEVIAVYRGWDAFERAHGGLSIIDFDLTNINSLTTFSSRPEILSSLNMLREQTDSDSNESQFLRAKLDSSIFYLRALMQEQISFNEYVEHTLGVRPDYFNDDDVMNALNKVNAMLATYDLELKKECKQAFEDKLLIRDPKVIRQGIIGNQGYWLSRLREIGIPCPQQLNLHIEFANVDAYWSNWISGSFRNGFTLRINLHSRKQYDLGRPLALCLHEICGHAVQMAIWGELIEQGALNHAFGLTTVHSPETFVAEGLGQTVGDFLADQETLPREFWLSRWLYYYTMVILHNAHVMIYHGVPHQEILRFAITKLPFASRQMIEAELRDRSTNPLYRTYQLAYASSDHMITTLTRGWVPKQKQKLLIEMYTRPMTPQQLNELGLLISKRGVE